MKYVRVYESDCYPEEYITTYLNHCEHVVNLQDAGFDFEGCIVKQANTIEELCDEFVCDNKIVNVEYDLENNLWVNDKLFEDIKDIVYGAIWTGIGLIYVAKMNEKGELELL